MGPLLSSLTFLLIIEEIELKISGLTQHCWYLDYGIIAGTEIELKEALDIWTVSCEIYGLEFRGDKCGVWSKEALNGVDSRDKRNSTEGIKILSTAVGSPRCVAS